LLPFGVPLPPLLALLAVSCVPRPPLPAPPEAVPDPRPCVLVPRPRGASLLRPRRHELLLRVLPQPSFPPLIVPAPLPRPSSLRPSRALPRRFPPHPVQPIPPSFCRAW